MSALTEVISIKPRAPRNTVVDCMNASVGQQYWIGQDIRWRNFLAARNTFVRERLQFETGLSPKQFKGLAMVQRRYRIGQLERIFAAGFFQYTRDSDWMQEAVGNSDSWIYIHGMSAWHVKSALHALEHNSRGSSADSATAPTDSASSAQAMLSPLPL
ncbi:uncharacterized protein BP5553_03051 [Venustampulla echinocandica]|uniref:Uncharacterized protein n=1 Tax=Venustampulla echinocandica TaxID=2656787 RepID=A0A370TT46_9HELO|nr:uncharacterized protein BP5553_03051 [Venustampulla echinocandica]RDL38711.1 hypothetical protein BP5553_03051 [Venustampulla echinocandica]